MGEDCVWMRLDVAGMAVRVRRILIAWRRMEEEEGQG